MPKAKRDKSRKDKVLKYKKSKKMAKFPETKPFRQVPTWASNETFELQGVELESLYNFLNIFAPAMTTIQQVFARGVQSGKIKINYEYEDGTLVPDSEISAYTQQLNEYYKQKLQEEAASKNDALATAEPEKEEAPTAKILSFTGEPVSSAEVDA